MQRDLITVDVTNTEINRQKTVAVTEWVHCQRQLAFFLCAVKKDNQIENLQPSNIGKNQYLSHLKRVV